MSIAARRRPEAVRQHPLRYDPARLWATSIDYQVISSDGTFPPWIVQPCGWTRVFLFEVGNTPDDWHAEIKVRLLDPGRRRGAEFAVLAEGARPEYPYHASRIFTLWLPEPLANVNAAWPYTIEIEADRGCTVTASQLFHPMAA